jgi:hypothetical protein
MTEGCPNLSQRGRPKAGPGGNPPLAPGAGPFLQVMTAREHCLKECQTPRGRKSFPL